MPTLPQVVAIQAGHALAVAAVVIRLSMAVAPRTYFEHVGKCPTAPEQRDEYLLEQIRRTDPWHRLGTTVAGEAFTAEDAMTLGHLGGWNVRKAPVTATRDPRGRRDLHGGSWRVRHRAH